MRDGQFAATVYAALAISAASAAATASGVPTCIQMPSRRSPCSRPASAARSNSGDIDDGPGADAGEERRRQDRGAGIDERHHVALAAALEPAVGGHREIAAAGIAGGGRGRRHQQQRVHARGVERGREPLEIGHHAVDPDGVGIDQEERPAAELRHRLDRAAGGAEQLARARRRSRSAAPCVRRGGARSGRRGGARSPPRARRRPAPAGRAHGRSAPCRRPSTSGFGIWPL